MSQSLYHDGGFCGEDRLQGLVVDGALVVCVKSGAAQAEFSRIGLGVQSVEVFD